MADDQKHGVTEGEAGAEALPSEEVAAREPAADEAPAENLLRGKRVLIVDYDSSFIDSIILPLQNYGAEVLIARDGYEGFVMVHADKPDVVVMETMLPRMGGYQLCRLIKYDKRFHMIPVMICSLREHTRDRDMGRQVGCNDYLLKPVDPQQLIWRINRLLKMAQEGKGISPLEAENLV